jgi:hypothetical protein
MMMRDFISDVNGDLSLNMGLQATTKRDLRGNIINMSAWWFHFSFFVEVLCYLGGNSN